MDVLSRHHVTLSGPQTAPAMVFMHGFGCAQEMWRFVAPAFEPTHRVVLFDHAGSGSAAPEAYDTRRHASLDGYAADVVGILDALGAGPATLVGHSVSGVIAVLVAKHRPDLVSRLVLVCPSPRYIDDEGYRGGFARDEVEELLATMDDNYLGWSANVAPMIMGAPGRPELGEELTASFCRTDPQVARRFARATFLSDNRADLRDVRVPALVVQSSVDAIAPPEVGRYVHDNLAGSELVTIDNVGHCPNLSAPDQLVAVMRDYLAATAPAGAPAG